MNTEKNMTTNDWPVFDEQSAVMNTQAPSVWYS